MVAEPMEEAPLEVAKPRLDRRCEWNRGEIAFAGTVSLASDYRPVTACTAASTGPKSQWCSEHECGWTGCTLAKVRDGLCVGHQPGAKKRRLADTATE